MLFNSLEFAIFLPLVFIIYWFVVNRNLKFQNLFIVLVSYLFYGWWDWRFLILIAITSLASYLSGTLIEKHREKRSAKVIAASNIVLNLLILCTFKYFNFFSENFALLFKTFGAEIDWVTLDILLPVGISFYTFQALSYTIDVYKRKIEPTHDIVCFFAYVSFFPQLVAGPIERATNLLPQFYKERRFDHSQAVDGMRQILWGLFKKIVLADNCAAIANMIFNNYETASSSTLILGAVMFTFQIYGDFSGYSDIAIGTAKLFGIKLMRNFNHPYFSRDIAEFWRKWHISLTTWFRDYIYIPLGGSRGSKMKVIRNTFIVFLVSGFWHGANWTFVMWGLYHALLFMPLLILGKNKKRTDTVTKCKILPSWRETLQMLVTFILVVFGWIIFRSETITDAYTYITNIFNLSIFTAPVLQTALSTKISFFAIFSIIFMLIVEWINRDKEYGLAKLPKSIILRWTLYMFITYIVIFNFGSDQPFIYFQF